MISMYRRAALRRVIMRLRWKPCLVSALSVLLISGARAAPQEASEALSFVTWREPNEGAYSLSVPQGWKISGGIWRRTPVDVRSAVNVVSQGGAIHLFIGDYDVPPAREPDAVTQMAGLREGQIYDGTLLARYQTGVQFAQRYPAWKLCRQPQIVQSGILRKQTETLNAEVGRPTFSDSAADCPYLLLESAGPRRLQPLSRSHS